VYFVVSFANLDVSAVNEEVLAGAITTRATTDAVAMGVNQSLWASISSMELEVFNVRAGSVIVDAGIYLNGWEPEIGTVASELTAFLHNNTAHFDAAPYLDPFEADRVEVVATYDPRVESVSLLDVFSYQPVTTTFAPPFWASSPPPSPPSPPPPVPAGKSFQDNDLFLLLIAFGVFAVVVALGALAFRYFLKEDRVAQQQNAIAPWGQDPYGGGDKGLDMYGQPNGNPRGEAMLDDYDDYYGAGAGAGGGDESEYGELDPPTPPPASADGHRPKRRPRGEAGRQPNFDDEEPRGRGRRGGGGADGAGGRGGRGARAGGGGGNKDERQRIARDRARRVMGGDGDDDGGGGAGNEKLAMWRRAGREKRGNRR